MSNAYVGDYDGPSPQGIDWQGGVGNWGIARYGDDRRTIVLFHREKVRNSINSEAAGRPIFDEWDFVRIQHPGEREQTVDRKVQESDKMRWPREWAQYQKGQEQKVDGTPLDLLFPNHPSIAANLAGLGITVVEQLANLSATAMHNVGMGAQDYVNYARTYLEHAKKGVGFHEMQKQLAERDAKIRIQGQQIEGLMSQVAQLLKQNAAIIGAMPVNYAPQAAVGAPPSTPVFTLPPIPARMPDPSTSAQGESAKAAAAKAGWEKRRAKAAEAQQEPEPANAAD
jgi:hypothetical protein